MELYLNYSTSPIESAKAHMDYYAFMHPHMEQPLEVKL